MTKNIYQCNQCEKTFKSNRILKIHKYRAHNKDKNKIKHKKKECPTCNLFVVEYNFENHLHSRRKCLQCNNLFCVSNSFDKNGNTIRKSSNNRFCSSSCSATYNNIGRELSKETRNKISNSMKITKLKKKSNSLSPRNKNNIKGPYTKLFLNKCYHCEKIFYSRTKMKYCLIHKELYSEKNRMNYRFNFNYYNYPTLFDIKLIEKVGWYCSDKKSKKYNPNGLSRDHKVSVSESIRNNYDPYYINHPLNCEIMLHSDNNSKNDKCSISYTELVQKIDQWDIENQK